MRRNEETRKTFGGRLEVAETPRLEDFAFIDWLVSEYEEPHGAATTTKAHTDVVRRERFGSSLC